MNIKKHLKPFFLGLFIVLFFSFGIIQKDKTKDGAKGDFIASLFSFLNSVERVVYDTKFQKRAPELPTNKVVVAKIDDASLEKWGRWPWSRGIYNVVLQELYDLGAEVVAFDVVFSEPEFQERYITGTISDIQAEQDPNMSEEEKIKLTELEIGTLAKRLPLMGEQQFARALKKYPKTVLGYVWQDESGCPLYDPSNPKDLELTNGEALTPEAASQRGLLHIENYGDRLGYLANQGHSIEGSPPFPLKRAERNSHIFVGICPLVNRPTLSAAAQNMGFFSTMPDVDGLFRRVLLLQGFVPGFVPESLRDFLPSEWTKHATVFPSLSLKSVMAYLDSTGLKVDMMKDKDGKNGVKAIQILRKEGPPLVIATLPDGTLPVNYYGPQKRIIPGANGRYYPPVPEISLGETSHLTKDVDFLKHYGMDAIRPLQGKIVMIGPTALGVYDLRPTPVDGDMTGVFIHATTASRLLEYADNPKSHYSIRFADPRISIAVLIVVGLLLSVYLAVSPALAGSLGFVLSGTTIVLADFFIFKYLNYAMDTGTILLSMMSVSGAIIGLKYFTEERERAFVKGAFEKYVSPDVVGDILKDPKKLNLGGQKKKLTVMFSDIRGFTTISEKMGASELANFLNDYLSPMTDIIQENRGTIDKYMGDAIMAIFGAPIEFANHAEKGVDAALAMLSKLEDMRLEWRKVGLPEIDIGVGLNTGDMSVGNMGSRRIFSYTVMGDSVNLGSRLEGINKEYGTRLIVSEYTRAELGPDYVCRELDRVKVKGKKLPVTIFEVMGKGELPEKRDLAKRFDEALQLYYSKKFTEAKEKFAVMAPTDPTSDIYLERCDMWMQEPPPDDWDGSWTMKTK